MDWNGPTGPELSCFSCATFLPEKSMLKLTFIFEGKAATSSLRVWDQGFIFQNGSAEVNSIRLYQKFLSVNVWCQPYLAPIAGGSPLVIQCITIQLWLSNVPNHHHVLNIPLSYQCNSQILTLPQSSEEKNKPSTMKNSYPVTHNVTC